MGKHGRGKGWLTLAGSLAAAALLLIFVLFVRISEVEVSGNIRYTKEQMEEAVFDTNLSRNTVICYLRDRFRPHKTIPFVEDYKIVFRSLNRAEIIVYEKSVVGYVSYMSSMIYFDKDGVVVESTSERLPGIPMINGLEFGHIVLHRPLPVEDPQIFSELLNLTQILEINEITVDQIEFTRSRRMRCSIGTLLVELGDNAQMNGKIGELRSILKEYPDLDGTLYLDTYDESNLSPMFRFEKKSK